MIIDHFHPFSLKKDAYCPKALRLCSWYLRGVFKKKQSWISELDVFITDNRLIPVITRLHTENSMKLPSDLPPLEISLNLNWAQASSDATLKHSANLGAHKVPFSNLMDT